MTEERLASSRIEPLKVLEVLRAIHRGDNSHIAFVRKTESGFENLFSYQLAELEATLPTLGKWLIQDAYFTVNGMYGAARYKSKVTKLPGVKRREEHVRFLNACYVDLDVGRAEGSWAQMRTWADAQASVTNLTESGKLPQASIFARSGRGLYVFWLLRDDADEHQPPRCYTDSSLVLYKEVNRAIARRLSDLAADVKAVDAARVLRVPGTLHGVTRKPATYFFAGGDDGAYSYTLAELAAHFDVPLLDASLPYRTSRMVYGQDWSEEVEGRSEVEDDHEVRPAKRYPKRANGKRIMRARRAYDLATLEQARGGWVKGRRAFHLGLYATFLCGAGETRDRVLESVRIMAKNCHPAYPSEPNDATLQNIVAVACSPGEQAKRMSNDTLCKWLDISPELAIELALLTIIPSEIADQVKAQRQSLFGGQREAIRQARRRDLQLIIRELGMMSSRKLAALLRGRGWQVSDRTVNEDLNALGYAQAPSRKAGRPCGQMSLAA